jgi:serine/threonine-protein kinase
MTFDHYAKVKELFLSVVNLSKDEQEELLRSFCQNNPDLREAVEKLLQFHSETNSPSDKLEKTKTDSESAGNYPSGTLFANRFLIVSLIGTGGMGKVYRAEDKLLGQTVALKFLPKYLSSNPELLSRLHHEVRIAREITHHKVCRIFDIAESDGVHFISMEYISGENLKSLLHRIGRIPADKALEISLQLCAGLSAVHAQGILHRDLKPANVMLDENGQVKLTDFGLACKTESVSKRDISAGTPAYMSPEQVIGKEVTVRSDIYSLGLILYEIFNGKPAYSAQSPAELIQQKTGASIIPPFDDTLHIDPAIQEIICRCLDRNPEDRPDSVLSVSSALSGEDILSAALRSGILPTPELVASAEQSDKKQSPSTMLYLAAIIPLLLATIYLTPWVHPIVQVSSVKSPEVLTEKARTVIERWQPEFRPKDFAYGFLDNLRVEFLGLQSNDTTHSDYSYAPVNDVPIEFWYRAGRKPLVPSDSINDLFFGEQIKPYDPTPNQQGIVNLVLDMQGNLLGFEAKVSSPADAGFLSPSVNWSEWFRFSGLDMNFFREAQPKYFPRISADRRYAWKGKRESNSDEEITVEASTYHGQLVFWVICRTNPKVSPSSAAIFHDPELRRTFISIFREILVCILIFMSLLMLRINLLKKRSDPQGAFTLALFIFVVRMIIWILQTHFASDLVTELHRFALATIGALIEATLVCLFYLALEPYVRQFWPHAIISWSRLMQGKFRDPLVGNNILLGSLLGIFLALLFRLDRVITFFVGLPVREAVRRSSFFTNLLGSRYGIASCLNSLCDAIYEGIFLLLIVVLMRAIIRRSRLAGIAAVLCIAPLFVPSGSHSLISWIVIGIGCVGTAVWMLIRSGLVSVITGIFLCLLLLRFPLTLSRSIWYADSSFLALSITVGIIVLGFGLSQTKTKRTHNILS